MKYLNKAITVVLLLLCFGPWAFGQNVNLNFNGITVRQAISELRQQSGYSFVYESGDLDLSKTVSIHATTLQDAIGQIISGQNVSYTLKDHNIVISRKAPQGPQRVSGRILDENGEPVIGASIMVKGTRNGTLSDIDGRYVLDAPAGTTLVVSCIGFAETEIVATSSPQSIVLKEDKELLDEVVVVGYGTIKKSDLTGAVSSVRSKDLPPSASTSVSQMLAGRAAGLTAYQTSAQPGGAVELQIRGAASNRSPLIVIDGIAQTGFSQVGSVYVGTIGNIDTGLNSLNPNDIESIEILKDASATSIYGARAAGGVILITTKHGKEGKTEVNYKGSISIQKVYGMPKMLNKSEFMHEFNETRKELWMRENLVYPYGTLDYDTAIEAAKAAGKSIWAPAYSDSEIANAGEGTDWLGEIMRNGVVREHNLSVSGGTDKTKYMTSFGYYDQDAVVKHNGFRRFNLGFNIDQKFSKYVTGGLIAKISQVKTDNVPLGTGKFENSGIIAAATNFSPVLDIRDENGNYTTDPISSFHQNPVSFLEITDKSRTERLLASTYVQVDPFKGFNIRALFGVDRNQGKRNYYLPTSVAFGAREGGYASIAENEKTDYTVNVIANYRNEWGNHSLAVMAGYEFQRFTWNGHNLYNSDFPYDAILWYNMSAGKRLKPGVGSNGGKSEIASYISRINYSYADRYLLTANLRVDGSSNFAKNNRWGVFPGISVAWKIHNEDFMAGTRGWLSELKLRAGFGQTGNDNLSGINSYYSTGWDYIFDNTLATGIGLAALGNPDLKWETQTDINVGLDFGLFNQRITGTFEYFNRIVSDILGTRQLMSFQEVNRIAANLDAEKLSNGYELSLHSNNITKSDFSWTTDFTLTYYRDRWNKRDESWKPDINSNKRAFFNELWYYQSDGLVSVNDTEYIQKYGAIPGTVKILDVNGYLTDSDGNNILDKNGKPQYSGAPDGKIDNADLVKVGVNIPVSMGLNNTFYYKNFDLNIYLYGMFNRWKVNDTKSYYNGESFRIRENGNLFKESLNRWSYNNMDSKIPSAFQAYSNFGMGDFYLEKAWFIRCRNITLGYSIPTSVLSNKIAGIRFYVDFQNPFIITPYNGTDPETDYMTAYPNQHTYTAGINVKF